MNTEWDHREKYVDIRELVLLIKQKMVFIVACGLVSGLAGLGLACFIMHPVYEASAKMIVNTGQSQETMINQENVTAQELVDTYAVIIRSRTVLVPVLEKLNLKMDYEELYENVRVEAVEGTTIMEISVQDPSRQQAEAIVKEILRVSPEIVVKAVDAGSVRTIEEAYCPEKPISPGKWSIAVIAFLLGMQTAIVIVLLWHFMNNTYQSAQQLQNDLGISVIGIIPSMESCKIYYGRAAKEYGAKK